MMPILLLLAAVGIDFISLFFSNETYDFLGIQSEWWFLVVQNVFFIVVAIGIHRIYEFETKRFVGVSLRSAIVSLGLFFCMVQTAKSISVIQGHIAGVIVSREIIPDDDAIEKMQPSAVFGREVSSNQKFILEYAKIGLWNAVISFHEELYYRWLCIGLLLLVVRPTFAVLISSFLFGVMHMVAPLSNHYDAATVWSSVFTTTAIGIYLGFFYLRAGLLASTCFHFLNNLIVIFSGTAFVKIVMAISVCSAFAIPLMLIFQRRVEINNWLSGIRASFKRFPKM